MAYNTVSLLVVDLASCHRTHTDDAKERGPRFLCEEITRSPKDSISDIKIQHYLGTSLHVFFGNMKLTEKEQLFMMSSMYETQLISIGSF